MAQHNIHQILYLAFAFAANRERLRFWCWFQIYCISMCVRDRSARKWKRNAFSNIKFGAKVYDCIRWSVRTWASTLDLPIDLFEIVEEERKIANSRKASILTLALCVTRSHTRIQFTHTFRCVPHFSLSLRLINNQNWYFFTGDPFWFLPNFSVLLFSFSSLKSAQYFSRYQSKRKQQTNKHELCRKI